jgi:hypothetical protein
MIVLALARPRVIVTEAVEGPVVAAFYSTGTIQPEREYPIKSNTAGLLKEVRVDKGARVKKGDVLAIVEDPALTFAGQEAQAMLEEKLQRIDAKLSPVLQEYDSKIAAMNDLLDIAKREQKRVTDSSPAMRVRRPTWTRRWIASNGSGARANRSRPSARPSCWRCNARSKSRGRRWAWQSGTSSNRRCWRRSKAWCWTGPSRCARAWP